MNYATTELEIAAFLRARGHDLVQARFLGRLVQFEFGPTAEPDVLAYIGGAQMAARDLFEAHRHLRTLVKQIKQHHYQNRTDTHENTSSTRQ